MLPPRRSLPTQRMAVRSPGGVDAHKTFRLTRPVKMKFIARGFGKDFIPAKFQKIIKAKSAAKAATQEEAYFLRHARDDKTLTSSEQMKRFSKGFLQEAHEEGAKLRPGFNPSGNESEQAQKLLKSYKAEVEKVKPWQERVEHRQKIDSVRQRLGILHGQGQSDIPPAAEEPTPLGHGWTGGQGGWSGPKEAKAAAAKSQSTAPSLSAGAGPFLGGNISAVGGRHRADSSGPSSTIKVQHRPADALFLGRSLGDLDASRLTVSTGITVESRRTISPTESGRNYAIVLVEDEAEQLTLQPTEVPRPRTALIVFGRALTSARQTEWQQVGATEIINLPPTLELVQTAIERYIRPRSAPAPAVEPTLPETIHELPI